LKFEPRVEIEYCTKCKWLLRSAWLAQEVLQTFEDRIGEVSLIPAKNSSGTFIIRINERVIWDRRNNDSKGFPEAKILKQLIRDEIDPTISLGHSDYKGPAEVLHF
jgi:selenoprotein W-related protein